MKKSALVGLLVSIFGVFVMSHNVGAATRLGGYTGYTTNISGFPANGVIVNNRDYPITASQSDFYLANGNWANNYTWEDGKEYHLSLAIVLSGSGIASVVPEGINIQGNNYRTESDTITSSVSCTTQTCKYIVIHDVLLVGVGNGVEQVKTPSSNVLNAHSSGNTVANFTMAVYLYDNEDEWREWRSNTSNVLNEISGNTSDTVDILDQIYDRLDVLDKNADKNAEAWDNMQNTDGLIDVGENQSFLDSFNAFNSFLGGLKNKVADDCVIDGDLGHIDLGDVDLCNMPSNVRSIIATISGVVFAVLDLFIVWSSIKYVVAIIDWARRN